MVPLLAARHRTKRRYVLSALVRCSICGRRMQGNSVRDHSWYRWKFPSDYAITERISHPKSVQVQEDSITAGLDAWLAKLTDPANVDELAAQLATVADVDKAAEARAEAARARIVDCDERLASYRRALEGDAPGEVVGAWIAEVRGEGLRADKIWPVRLPPHRSPRRGSKP